MFVLSGMTGFEKVDSEYNMITYKTNTLKLLQYLVFAYIKKQNIVCFKTLILNQIQFQFQP